MEEEEEEATLLPKLLQQVLMCLGLLRTCQGLARQGSMPSEAARNRDRGKRGVCSRGWSLIPREENLPLVLTVGLCLNIRCGV